MKNIDEKIIVSPLNDELKLYAPDTRAIWSLGRLYDGRDEFDSKYMAIRQKLMNNDDILKKYDPEMNPKEYWNRVKALGKIAIKNIWEEIKTTYTDERELQFITKGKRILNIATVRHLILNRAEIIPEIEKSFEEHNLKMVTPFKNYLNYVCAVKQQIETQFGTLKVGLGIELGNNFLTKAIKFCIYLEIEVCSNPLTFLRLENTMETKLGLLAFRIMRIQTKKELPLKIKENTELTLKSLNEVPQLLEHNGQQMITQKDAKASILAMTNAYGIKNDSLKDTIFQELGNKTDYKLWDIANVLSNLAITYEFRSNAVHVGARLSAIGLVMLTTNEIPKMIANSYAYCKEHEIKL
jgi:hypothetical protein